MRFISNGSGLFQINDEAFKPIRYKDVCICASSLNKDTFHIQTKLKQRSKNQYSLDDVITIVKRAIDKYLKELIKSYPSKHTFSCCIISKEFHLIKVEGSIKRNTAKNLFGDQIESASYLFFIHTVLSSQMIEDQNDFKLYVQNKNKILNLYVD